LCERSGIVNPPPQSEPPIIPEVLPPNAPVPPFGDQSGTGSRPSRGRAPFHAQAAVLLLVVDNLWNLADWTAILLVITVPLCFLCVAVPTFFIQRNKHGDSAGKAFLKALFLGAVAAVPFSVTGTPIGLALLAWAGIKPG
jgi:hypothetical protein